ncbi:MAG: winged helix-turn-helix domain-containing protein [Muribaculaceae bacterium]|nr:winged helix-turn-helix domain-containing protein [Muribaculaceae bacterium]
MDIESIGTWAGEVYKALEASQTHTLGDKEIKKATKLKKDQIMAALGWLGREGKVAITTEDKDIIATLVGE